MAHSILLVDDSFALTQLLEKKLKESFPTSHIKVVRLAAEAYLSAVSERPDLVLVDYALPDMQGDEICRLLYHNPMTSLTPVVMFYGDGVDIPKLQAANPNVVATLQKPFRPDELVAEVQRVFSQPRIAMEIKSRFETSNYKDLGIASSKVLFRANTALFPLAHALRYLSEESLSGVLRILLKKNPIELYLHHGRVCLATTKDLQLYSIDSTVQLSEIDRESMATAAKGQMDSSCPYFILLALRGAMPGEAVTALVESHGKRLVGRAFLASRVAFEFEDLNTLPEFVRDYVDTSVEAVGWGFDCLRQISPERIVALGRYDVGDTPAYSPESFRLLEKLELDPAESRFAAEVDGSTSLESLAAKIEITETEVLALFFRFSMMGVMDLWPASVFQH